VQTKDCWRVLEAVVSYVGDGLVFTGRQFGETFSRSTFFEDLDVLVTGQVGGKRTTE
jgi:hypothetical protein